jgi:hypothetical protein
MLQCRRFAGDVSRFAPPELTLAENGTCLPLSIAWPGVVAPVHESAQVLGLACPLGVPSVCLPCTAEPVPSLQDQLFIIAYPRPLLP